MDVWEVKPGEVFHLPTGWTDPRTDSLEYVRLTQVSLGETKVKKDEEVQLFSIVDGCRTVVASLHTINAPQKRLDVTFDGDIDLFHDWKDGSVHVHGYWESNAILSVPVKRPKITVLHPELWNIVIPYVRSQDKPTASEVCKSWYEIDRVTRNHATVKFPYRVRPERLFERFPELHSVKIKGVLQNPVRNFPMTWDDFITKWFKKIVECPKIQSIDVKRMIVTDEDIDLLLSSDVGKTLKVLKFRQCQGFSTHGLLNISGRCRDLKCLSVERSGIINHDGDWLHELASMRQIHYKNLAGVCDEDFTAEDFEIFYESVDNFVDSVQFPIGLSRFSLDSFGSQKLPLLISIGYRLTKLNFKYAYLDDKDYCALLAECPNLEILKTTEMIGDEGLKVAAATCNKLKKLRLYRRRGDQDGSGVSERGLVELVEGCVELEYLTLFMTSVTNEALTLVSTNLKRLCNFQLMLFRVNSQQSLRDRVLDMGVQSLLKGCPHLTHLALHFFTYWLTVNGIKSIVEYGKHVKILELDNIITSDEMLRDFDIVGLQKLEVLNLSSCRFEGVALGEFVRKLKKSEVLVDTWVCFC